jgi:hypothetical protein
MLTPREQAYGQAGLPGYGYGAYGAYGASPLPFGAAGTNYGQFGIQPHLPQGPLPSHVAPLAYGLPATLPQAWYGGLRSDEFAARRHLPLPIANREYIGTQTGYPGSGFQGSSGPLQPGFLGTGEFTGYGNIGHGPLAGYGNIGYGNPAGVGNPTGYGNILGQASMLGQGFGPGLGHRGQGPKGYTRSDERIKEDISERLSEDPFIDASDVTVEARQGVVTLTGSVDSRQLKHRIEDVVECCSGVKDIENRLAVRAVNPLSTPGGGSRGQATTGAATGKPS